MKDPEGKDEMAWPDGVAMIAAERERQIAGEGWTAEHDDAHRISEMAWCAICYALGAARQVCNRDVDVSRVPSLWPLEHSWWKPSRDPLRNLVKAGALIAAEIDRLQRAAAGGRKR